jgi:hypothetical protein
VSHRSSFPFVLTARARRLTRIVAALVLATLGACTTSPPTPPAVAVVRPAPTPLYDPDALSAVLVAGDSEQPVFDNAIGYLHDALINAGVPETQIHQLSVRYAATNEPATLDRILARIAATHPPANGGCLVFMTSHGVFGQGLYLELSDAVLTPGELDKALRQGCGSAPTVAIVSSCFSGKFAAAPLIQANRTILTASAPDRSSFGCGADFTYTYFDDCLLGSLDGAATWKEIFRRTAGCVAQREMQSGAQPSQPRASFGMQVADLPAPWRRPEGVSPTGVVFMPSGKSFDPARVPIADADRLCHRRRSGWRRPAKRGRRRPYRLAALRVVHRRRLHPLRPQRHDHGAHAIGVAALSPPDPRPRRQCRGRLGTVHSRRPARSDPRLSWDCGTESLGAEPEPRRDQRRHRRDAIRCESGGACPLPIRDGELYSLRRG